MMSMDMMDSSKRYLILTVGVIVLCALVAYITITCYIYINMNRSCEKRIHVSISPKNISSIRTQNVSMGEQDFKISYQPKLKTKLDHINQTNTTESYDEIDVRETFSNTTSSLPELNVTEDSSTQPNLKTIKFADLRTLRSDTPHYGLMNCTSQGCKLPNHVNCSVVGNGLSKCNDDLYWKL